MPTRSVRDEQHAAVFREVPHEHQSLLLLRAGLRDPDVEVMGFLRALDVERAFRESIELDELRRLRLATCGETQRQEGEGRQQ